MKLTLSWSQSVEVVEDVFLSWQQRLTFVASIDFGLANEGRTVDLVAAQEHIGRVCIATADIARDGMAAAAIVPLVASTAASE